MYDSPWSTFWAHLDGILYAIGMIYIAYLGRGIKQQQFITAAKVDDVKTVAQKSVDVTVAGNAVNAKVLDIVAATPTKVTIENTSENPVPIVEQRA